MCQIFNNFWRCCYNGLFNLEKKCNSFNGLYLDTNVFTNSIQDTPYETIAGVIFGPQTHIKEIAILIQSIVREISFLHSKQSYICITHNDLSLQFARQHGNKRNIYEEQTLYFRFSCVSKFKSLISKVSIYIVWSSQHHQKGICPDKIQEK